VVGAREGGVAWAWAEGRMEPGTNRVGDGAEDEDAKDESAKDGDAKDGDAGRTATRPKVATIASDATRSARAALQLTVSVA
jgi:hypothetical protein